MAAPQTLFELSASSDPSWTPLTEETQFLADVEAQSARVRVVTLGASVNGHPMRMVAIGYPTAPTDAELRSKSNIFVLAMQHGNECSGRDAVLETIRDLAFSNDSDTLAYLHDHPIMFFPTTNPDGFPSTRNNANNKNINRDWIGYLQPETQAAGIVFRDYRPHVMVDIHEMYDRSAQFSTHAQTHQELSAAISSLNQSLRSAAEGRLQAEGFTTKPYSLTDPNAHYLSNHGGFRNIACFLLETGGQTINTTLSRKEAVFGNKAVINEMMLWHKANLSAVRSAASQGALDAIVDGQDRNPVSLPAIQSPPGGYTITAAQMATAGIALDRMGLKAYETTSNDFYIPMAQGSKKLLPMLVDSRAAENVVSATPVTTTPTLLASPPRLANVKWRKAGETDISGAALALDADTTDVLDFEPATSYEWAAQNQEVSETSEYSSWQEFATLEQVRYEVEYRDVATHSILTDLVYNETEITVNGLTPEEDYEWRVREAGDTGQSAWTPWSGFTTASGVTAFGIANAASGIDSWSAKCGSVASLSSASIATDNVHSIAAVNTSILSAANASDTAGDAQAALTSFKSVATGSVSVDAFASASGALSAGSAAGESWSAQAQVLANMLSGAAGSDEIARQTDSAINAAVDEGSAASDQFLAALESIASVSEGATTSDAYMAVVTQLAGIASGAIASDTFNLDFGFPGAIQSGAISGETWLILAALTSELSDTVTASDLMTARASVSASLVSGAAASDRFAIVNAGIQYLVMGAITLRSALNYSVNIKP